MGEIVSPVGISGTAGGLALWWRPNVKVEIISSNNYVIDSHISFCNGAKTSRISWFYGPPYIEDKHKFWPEMNCFGAGLQGA